MANKQLMNKKLLIYRFMITLKLEIDKLYLLPSLRKNYKGNETGSRLCHRLSAHHVFTCAYSTNINIGACLKSPSELLQIHIAVGVNQIHFYGSKSPPLFNILSVLSSHFFTNLKTYIK